MNDDQVYFYETTWNYLRLAQKYKVEGRRAKAQEMVLEARYYAQKVPAEFMEPELVHNLEVMSKTLMRGY